MGQPVPIVYFDRYLHFACDFATGLVTWDRCHGNQERLAEVTASLGRQ